MSGIGLLAGPFNGAGYKPGPAPSVEDVLEQGLRQAAASPVHLAVRGVVRTSAQREAAVRFWLELDDAAILPSAAETERRFMAELDRMKAAYPATVRSNFQAIGWGGPADAGARTPAPGIRRGKGIACTVSNSGASPTSTSFVRLHADGTATVHIGTTEIGQGSRSVMAQIVGQELQLPMERVSVLASDTSLVPYDRSTGSSRSTTLMGLAVQDAATDVRAQLLEIAGRHFEAPVETLAVQDGSVLSRGERVTFAALIRQKFGGAGGELLGRGYVTPDHPSGRLKESPVFWEVSIGGAEVEVDEATGATRILKYVSIADAGKAINPSSARARMRAPRCRASDTPSSRRWSTTMASS